MSFTLDIIDELTLREPEKSCCKKSFLFGLFFGAEKISKNEVKVELKTEQSALLALSILKKQFSAEPSFEPIVRAGRRMFLITVLSKPLSFYIEKLDREENISIEEFTKIVGFNHPDCKRAFLSGVFSASGTATDPQKRYSLEFGVKSKIRALWLAEFLTAENGAPSYIEREARVGLYYKGNENIADILTYMGAQQACYTVLNAYAAHVIRNQENRATNCVLKNIEKSVSATRKQIEAIELLKSSGRFKLMSEDLKYTAKLRCKYDSATLSELAALHEPSISKSGLNRRLERILSFANEE